MKERWLKPLYFGALFLLTLVAGVFWGTWFTLTRSLEAFTPAEFIHIGQTIIRNVAVPMRVIMPSYIVFMGVSAWLYPVKKSMGFYLNVIANVLIIVTLLITLLVLVPIDNQIKAWTVATMPPDWISMREQWQFFHSLRTLTSLAAFGCLALSIVYIPNSRL
jgi:uncharacterized membrane protein